MNRTYYLALCKEYGESYAAYKKRLYKALRVRYQGMKYEIDCEIFEHLLGLKQKIIMMHIK